jgi:hypothetical protein
MIKSRRMRWADYVAQWGRRGIRIGYWWESQKVRHHWEDQEVGGLYNIKIDLREIGWDGMDWIDLSQDRDQRRGLVNTVMNLRVL